MKGQANHTEGLMLEEPSHNLERSQEGQELEKKEEPVPHASSRDEIPNLFCQERSNTRSEEDQDEGQEEPPDRSEVPIKKEVVFQRHVRFFSGFS
jgi:hypothetical protein